MRITSFILCVLLSVSATAQVQYVTKQLTRAELEAQRKTIQDELKETEEALQQIKSNKKATMGELSALQNKLALRQRQISNINDELGDIDNTIRNSSKEIGTMKQKLQVLKVRYAQSIRYAYETRSSYDMLAFLFSSRDFNDAMRRMKYLKKFRDFRKEQVDQIRNTQAQLQHKIGALNTEKADQAKLLSEQEQQRQTLLKDADQVKNVMQELKGKESELQKKIEKNVALTKKINNYIRQQIEKEMEESNRRAEEAKRKADEAAKVANGNKPPVKPGTTTNETPSHPMANNVPKPHVEHEAPTLLLTPTDVALASNFEGNRGKLYWPVDKGYITDHYGTHPHPLAPKVLIENQGIDIQSTENAEVRAVFEGTVSKVFSMIGSLQVVMIQHGNYFTVYNGLTNVSVKIGQHVNSRQTIGQVGRDENDVPIVKFQIWKSAGKKVMNSLNPEQWIGKAH
jgi:murein hydrolase activator